MKRDLRMFASASMLIAGLTIPGAALAQKSGGTLKIGHFDSPASMSMLEESTAAVNRPTMGVFNNLVMFKQDEPQNTPETIVPELATEWRWSEEGTELTFPLHQGVKWHDGKPFTAADVKCTWDLLTGRASEKLRVNPRKSWYSNLQEVTTNGDFEVTFHLKRPQPWLLTLLASGWSPIYPCHVPPREMRQHPIGTGPFKFVDFKPNESIKLVKNLDYWKPGLPYLDGIEFTIVTNRSTAILGFIAGKFDMTFTTEVTVPLIKDISTQAPSAICQVVPNNNSTNLLLNRTKPPSDNADIRRAVMLALDCKSFIQILGEGQGDASGAMQPPPEGLWGLPADQLATLP